MKSDIDDSERLFKHIVVLLMVNCVWVTITAVIHGAVSLEGLFSAYRLLASVLFAYAIHGYLTLRAIGLSIFWLATANSALVVVQLFDALSDQAFLPAWLKYGWLYGIEDIELWRKGGMVPSLQTRSLLATYGIFFGAWRSSRNVMVVALPFLLVAILVGARTFVPLGVLGVAYALIKVPTVTAAWLWILVWDLTGRDGFWEFFQLRFGGLLDIFIRLDFAADYSTEDTISSYRQFTLDELFVGNGEARYSDAGGKDPFYTRWLYQAGVLSVLLLLAVKAMIGWHCGRYSVFAYLVLVVAFYHNIKGELFTSFGTFDVLVLIAFVFLRERGGKALSGGPWAGRAILPMSRRHAAPVAV